ncbi:MAG: NAD-glutamate dehydrogenase [Rickettsiales bacterium]|nr:NAD-glutamate dehydrogenase [Rickettsiales bacterium]
MKHSYQQSHATQIKNILAALPKNASANLKSFIQQFYDKVPVDDMASWDKRYAVGLASSAFDFIQTRDVGAPKIRIFSPNHKQDGYECKHTVVEIVNDDMPFLVDSLSAELTRQGLKIRETIHPILTVTRDKKGKLQEVGSSGTPESLIHFEVSGTIDKQSQAQIIQDLHWVLTHIRYSVEDWHAIEIKTKERVSKLEKARVYFDGQTIAEVADFLKWLLNRNFIFLGYAEYDFFDKKGREALSIVPGTALGVLRVPDESSPRGLEILPPELRHFLLVPQLIEITKSNRPSLVHRPVLMDYIGLKRFDAKGNVVGEARILGLFTSNVYYQSTEAIPFLRTKVAEVLKRSGLSSTSHDGKSLKTILEFLPRDEIFQMTVDELFEIGMGILALEAKRSVRVFMRRDAFERFVSLMIFVPREQFSTDLRRQIQVMVEQAFNGQVNSFSTQITEAAMARLHLLIKTKPGDIPQVDVTALQNDIAKCAYQWSDQLLEALAGKYGDAEGERLHRVYERAFPQDYINVNDATGAAYDIRKIEEALASQSLVLDLFHDRFQPEHFVHLKIYNPNEQIALSDMLPILENAGFRVIEEHPFAIKPKDCPSEVWIRDFKLQMPGPIAANFTEVKTQVEAVMLSVWQGTMESDRFNALTLRAGIAPKQVVMLRAYAKYLKQIAFPYSQAVIEQVLTHYPHITQLLAQFFLARFDPKAKTRDALQAVLKAQIKDALSAVSSAADDRILSRYLELMEATLRTNYFQDNKPVLSFKFRSTQVPELPKPHPFAEIFVYSIRVEGIHLRGGKVARGGLRWSDRHEDFRTEILGLMKAQMVKNSVIVPVGSKGGFVVKKPPMAASREALQQEGIACYKLYLSGLLDITDNIINGKVTPPLQLVRHDVDDPYLVVAADKGTASFSDIANSVSLDYGFWLGDAFASGGSAGYDHKEMAITARGGWVSVTRHFQEMGINIAEQDFSVVGIGDMSGDVFGNGMLLSDHIRLLAAFNHMHIFIDPAPDAKKSFAERKRLFHLPRSSWKDYDAKLISKGGAIYERSAKSITVSKEAQAALGLAKTTFTPDELIQALLLAPVDLLWNGGIGTYVKAEEETHEQVGDRTNNAVRVNGKELRCKIVGEGGNLGFSQKGRIEYARSGGRINTDAIDNSAGVDCSDHEVNIKIALSREVSRGNLSLAKRNSFLESMTDEVARLVLKDNILQTQAISITQQQGVAQLDAQKRLIHKLEREGLLDRAIEFLPSDRQIADLKSGQLGLTRPEIAVLLAYSKMSLYRELLDSKLPDEAYFRDDLKRYFPAAMAKNYPEAIAAHPLKREIIATVVTNSMVNRAGITFCNDLCQDLGALACDVARAYTVVRDAFGLRDIWKAIEQSQATIPAAAQAAMYAQVTNFLEQMTGWLLRHLPLPFNLDAVAQELMPAAADYQKQSARMWPESTRTSLALVTQQWVSQNVPQELAQRVSALPLLAPALDIIAVAKKNALPIVDVGRTYFVLGERLELNWLHQAIVSVGRQSSWDRLALQALSAECYDEQRRLLDDAVTHKGGFDAWLVQHAASVDKLVSFITEIKSAGNTDLAKLMLVLKHARAI